MNQTLADTINSGLNNPECAFFVGQWLGQLTGIKIVFAIAAMLAVFKIIDKLALEPLIIKIKSKFKKAKS